MKKELAVCDFTHDTDVIATDTYDIRLNGSHQTGDICDEHKVELTDLLGTLVPMRRAARAQRARKSTTRKQTRKAAPKRRSRKFTDRDVRAWAAEKGIEVNSHGRIPNAVREQFLAAR